MAEKTGLFEWISKSARVTAIVTICFLAMVFVATVAMLVLAVLEGGNWTRLAPWILAMAAELVAVVWVIAYYGIVQLLIAEGNASGRMVGRLGRVEDILQDQAGNIRKLGELATLSDQAKSLIYRDRELDAFREIINANLMRKDYEAAEALINSIETKYGYAEEAARLRQEARETQKATQEDKVDVAIGRIDEILKRRNWAQALREADRLMQVFPESEKVASLPKRVEDARNRYKSSLLQSYGEAVRKNDVDGSIELLQRLDLYLSPQEAAALRESARGVFRAKLHNLGVQFAICVAEERWSDAVDVGEQIANEYPNSRMANEVSSKMDQLRTRAG